MRRALALFALLAMVPAPVQAEDQIGRFLKVRLLGNFHLPSRSMEPTLYPGDRVAMRPFIAGDVLERGDVIIFRKDNVDWVKRVIGLPGDSVGMEGGIVQLNNAPLAQALVGDYTVTKGRRGWSGAVPICANDPVADGEACVKSMFVETLPSGVSYNVLNTRDGMSLDDAQVVDVTDGHVFVMGDNRDNSLDSRARYFNSGAQLVPMDAIKYRGGFIYWQSRGAPGPRDNDF